MSWAKLLLLGDLIDKVCRLSPIISPPTLHPDPDFDWELVWIDREKERSLSFVIDQENQVDFISAIVIDKTNSYVHQNIDDRKIKELIAWYAQF